MVPASAETIALSAPARAFPLLALQQRRAGDELHQHPFEVAHAAAHRLHEPIEAGLIETLSPLWARLGRANRLELVDESRRGLLETKKCL